MSQIISLSPVTLTITIRPQASGIADVEARANPEHTDLMPLCQAMLGLTANYLQKIQQERLMPIVRKKQEGDPSGH